VIQIDRSRALQSQQVIPFMADTYSYVLALTAYALAAAASSPVSVGKPTSVGTQNLDQQNHPRYCCRRLSAAYGAGLGLGLAPREAGYSCRPGWPGWLGWHVALHPGQALVPHPLDLNRVACSAGRHPPRTYRIAVCESGHWCHSVGWHNRRMRVCMHALGICPEPGKPMNLTGTPRDLSA
jgi:hypothetical protein